MHTDITSTISGLSDDQLLSKPASSLALITRSMSSSSITCWSSKPGAYLSRGFSSLFDYVKRGLGYSDAASWRRINAMKLCTRIEGVRERLWDGSLTLDAARSCSRRRTA